MSNSEAFLNEEQLEIFALLFLLALSLPAEIMMMIDDDGDDGDYVANYDEDDYNKDNNVMTIKKKR